MKERFLNSWIFGGISNPWIWTPKIQDGFGLNPNPILLSYPNKGFGFGPPSNPNPNPNLCHPNRPQKISFPDVSITRVFVIGF